MLKPHPDPSEQRKKKCAHTNTERHLETQRETGKESDRHAHIESKAVSVILTREMHCGHIRTCVHSTWSVVSLEVKGTIKSGGKGYLHHISHHNL